MKPSEIKELIISSLDSHADPGEASGRLEDEGLSFDFNTGFTNKVLDKITSSALVINRKVEFVKSMNFVFSRIAITGVAAIIVLLISIFLMEGSLSFNSFLGISDSYDESIVSLLTGN
jgi:hypothetical protein